MLVSEAKRTFVTTLDGDLKDRSFQGDLIVQISAGAKKLADDMGWLDFCHDYVGLRHFLLINKFVRSTDGFVTPDREIEENKPESNDLRCLIEQRKNCFHQSPLSTCAQIEKSSSPPSLGSKEATNFGDQTRPLGPFEPNRFSDHLENRTESDITCLTDVKSREAIVGEPTYSNKAITISHDKNLNATIEIGPEHLRDDQLSTKDSRALEDCTSSSSSPSHDDSVDTAIFVETEEKTIWAQHSEKIISPPQVADVAPPPLAYVEGSAGSRIIKRHPSQIRWWDDHDTICIEISLQGCGLPTQELLTENLYLKIMDLGQSSLLTFQYLVEFNQMVVTLEDFYLRKRIIPGETQWSIRGLCYLLRLVKKQSCLWPFSSPFMTEGGKPVNFPWITVDPNNVQDIDSTSESSDDEDSDVIENIQVDENNNEIEGNLSWDSDAFEVFEPSYSGEESDDDLGAADMGPNAPLVVDPDHV